MLNQIKTILVMVVLAAASYGVYIIIWHKPAPTTTTAEGNSTLTPPVVTIPDSSVAAASALPGATPPTFTAAEPGRVGNPAEALNPVSPGLSPGAAATPAYATMPPTDSSAPLIAGPAVTGEPAGVQPIPHVEVTETAPPPESFPPPSATNQPPGDDLFQDKFTGFMGAVWKTLDEGHLTEAHLALSKLYEEPNLPEAQRRQITDLLDQLAGTVIYSRQHHLLEPPYAVQAGETLEQIAEKYRVPPLLLARINGIDEKQPLEPGMQLKVLHGPFNAVVHLERHELTLLVQGRYAGRFPIGIGVDCPKLEGEYTVYKKMTDPVYYGPDRSTIPPGDRRNPFGKYWIGLSDQIGLHGTNDTQGVGRDNNGGTISLGDRDIDDLYGILSVGSRVVIQR